ncbi:MULTISPECIES: ThiF family adenylyltransferase [Staphylococcus]|uniref:Dinucleotide-utilizing protein n=1 Tax=Staphylococcus agnetis TaxID=985762 RepID=A0A2T4MLJ3_9STAP|nr:MULTISPECIES: ThiF family adenylyltransferase [Staphylococcus]ALN77964.1 dinucleotide-utilizing protein [Staphylococcus agnetis]MDG4942974.1 ThiF family adenylyltransferase [Staphylococcus agnetis]NHM92214.1 dinucleotide-utilizing protein [Staphylococcus sp. 10602379]NJI02059.1 dinucleotide-utilizing protein [Staphylococcus agnetis]NJI13321.1 dinucleotide-utilizing protein [Staphylococcus agnetis]
MSRYDRQEKFHAFGQQGQQKLAQLHAFIVGVGALGSGIAEQLVRSGVGKLTILDKDIVSMSNLHRQSGYLERDANQLRPKVYALKERLNAMNSHVEINALNKELTSNNAETLFLQYQPDLILDGLDRYEPRYLLNEVCHKLDIPYIYSAVVGSQVSVFPIGKDGPCLNCLMPDVPETMESCAQYGVLPPAVHIASSLVVAEVFHYVMHGQFSFEMKAFDIYKNTFKSIDITELKEAACDVCQKHHYQRLTYKQQHTETFCGGVIQIRLTPQDFQRPLAQEVLILHQNAYVKRLKYKHYTMTFFQDGRLLIYGSSHTKYVDDVTRHIFFSS